MVVDQVKINPSLIIKVKAIHFLATALVLLVYASGFSQELKFDHLSVKQGLSQGNVKAIFQDHLGFIWAGTEDGLNFFDGYGFTVYRNEEGKPGSISNNSIDNIVEDKHGDLWVGTRNGLNRYDRELNNFEHFFSEPGNPNALRSNYASVVYVDSNDNLWVGTDAGLHLRVPNTKTFKFFGHDPANPRSIVSNKIEVIYEDNSNHLWIGTRDGLSMLNADSVTFTNYIHNPDDPSSLSSNEIRSLFEDSEHNLWIGTLEEGLIRMKGKTFTQFKNDPNDPTTIGGNYVTGIAESKAGELWIATDGALNRFDKATGIFTRYTPIPGDEHSLSSNIIVKVIFDKNDIMWVATRFGGINIYDKGKYVFRHFKKATYDKYSINENNITAFAEHKNGNFWVCTDGGGVNYYDRETGRFSNLYNLCTNNKTLAIAQDKNEGLWIGMWAGGLNYYDTKTKKIRRYMHDPANPRSISDNSIFDIIIDHNDNVWIATFQSGLLKYNPETDDFTRFSHDPNNSNTVAGGVISKIFEDSHGLIWIGTETQGADVFDPVSNTFTHYHSGKDPGELSGNNVYAFYEDSKGRLWLGTGDAGLNVFDRQTKKFKAYHVKDGLPNDAIQGVLEDTKGNIWVSTNKGLSRFNPETLKFKNFSESDGLQGDQFNRWSYLRLSTGHLLFGGTNGFNMFHVNDIVENTVKPPVYITDFKLFNKPVAVGENEILKKNILLTKEITLNYNENAVSFEFTALNFRKSERNKYKYIIEGLHEEWIDLNEERKISTSLPPGEFTFRVKGSNNDGLWNEEGATLKIIVTPPFWKTWWFNTAIALLVIYCILAYIRYQKKKAKQQQKELESVIEERTREISLQSEEIIKKAEQEKIYNWITQGLAQISEVISKNNKNLEELTNETLKAVVKYISAQQGVLAVAVKDEEEDEHLKIAATYGVSKSHWKTDRIEIGSGLLGETYKDKQKRVLENLPSGYIKIESGLGEAAPARIILLPLKTDDGDITGVMELAFLGDVSAVVQQFLDKVSALIALNIVASNLAYKTMLLLQQAKEQTEEMRAQEEEMRQNMEELEATQEEFRRREMEYQKRIEELERSH